MKKATHCYSKLYVSTLNFLHEFYTLKIPALWEAILLRVSPAQDYHKCPDVKKKLACSFHRSFKAHNLLEILRKMQKD